MAKYNSVPLGEAGTGSAYILPESRALQGLMQNIEYNRKMGLLNIQAKRDAALQTNKDFQDNQLKADSGILFQSEIDAASADWVKKGSEYRMKSINPWNPNPTDPQQVQISSDFLAQKAKIENMAKTRDVYQKNFLEQRALFEKGGYDEDSYKALNDFYANNKLEDIMKGGILPPTLTKSFDHSDFMKNVSDATTKYNTIKDGIETSVTAPNEDAIRYSIESNMARTPQAERFYMKKFGVDPAATPLKTLMRTTDPKEITTTLDQFYKTDPDGVKEAAKAFPSGVVPSYNSVEYKTFLNDQAKKQLQHETKFDQGLDELTREKVSGVDTEKKVGYNFGLQNEQRNQNQEARAAEGNQRARATFKMAQEDHANKIADRKIPGAANNNRDKFIQGVQVGNKEQMSDLRQLVKNRNGKVSYTKDGLLRLTYDKQRGSEIVPITKDIDISDREGEGYAHLNEVLTELTGKKIDLETLKGTKPYTGPILKTETRAFNSEEIKYLRNAFPKMEDLGGYLRDTGKYKTAKEAYKAAAEILDSRGQTHEIVFKKK